MSVCVCAICYAGKLRCLHWLTHRHKCAQVCATRLRRIDSLIQHNKPEKSEAALHPCQMFSSSQPKSIINIVFCEKKERENYDGVMSWKAHVKDAKTMFSSARWFAAGLEGLLGISAEESLHSILSTARKKEKKKQNSSCSDLFVRRKKKKGEDSSQPKDKNLQYWERNKYWSGFRGHWFSR